MKNAFPLCLIFTETVNTIYRNEVKQGKAVKEAKASWSLKLLADLKL